jgi:predicted secreted protein
MIQHLVNQTLFQINEYIKHGFSILGVIGINRSPSCGIQTTSRNNHEVIGEGVFMERLKLELEKNGSNRYIA